MTENIRESIRKLAAVLAVPVCGLAGVWWGLRTGGGLYYLTGWDGRLFFSLLMIFGLLFQGYSNLKTNRKYSAVYRILLRISGILISLLIYGWMVLVPGDFVVLILRLLLGIDCAPGAGGAFHLMFAGAAPEASPAAYGRIWGSAVWNFENPALLALLLSLVITAYGLIHAQKITTSFCRISLPGLLPKSAAEKKALREKNNSALRPEKYRMVQLSDLHMGSVVGNGYMRRVIRQVEELHPDCVVITGDIFNHGFVEELAHPEETEDAFRKLSTLCPDGIFAIPGNHDPQPDDPALQKFLAESGITLLYNHTVSLPAFVLAGRGSNHIAGRPPLSEWLAHPADGRPVVLLDHYPDGIHEAEEEKIDLMLCGHTHAGQYFPCNYLIRKRYPCGLLHGYSVWGATKCIVSAGTGFFQIPIRVGTDSEIVCIDLTA